MFLSFHQLELTYVGGENGEDIGLQSVQCATVLERHGVRRSVSEPDDTGDDADTDATGPEEPDSAPDNQTLIRLLEEQEKVRPQEIVTLFEGCLSTKLNGIRYSSSSQYLMGFLLMYASKSFMSVHFTPS